MFDFLKTIYPALTSIGLLASLIYIVIKEFRTGSNDVERKTFASYKERNTQLEEQMSRVEAELKSMGQDMARLTGIVEEKDKHIQSLTEIIQGRNPEVISLLGEIKDLNKKLIEFMHKVNDSNTKVLNYQTQMLEGQVKRDNGIDQSIIDNKNNT